MEHKKKAVKIELGAAAEITNARKARTASTQIDVDKEESMVEKYNIRSKSDGENEDEDVDSRRDHVDVRHERMQEEERTLTRDGENMVVAVQDKEDVGNYTLLPRREEVVEEAGKERTVRQTFVFSATLQLRDRVGAKAKGKKKSQIGSVEQVCCTAELPHPLLSLRTFRYSSVLY